MNLNAANDRTQPAVWIGVPGVEVQTKMIGQWAVLGLIALQCGCGEKHATPHVSREPTPRLTSLAPVAANATFLGFAVPAKPAVTPDLLARGRQVYAENCAACHGATGDGQGLCSAFLLPRPRNFRTAHFRLRSTPSGNLPTDADLFRVVSLGVNGTPMPPWRFHLDDPDRWAVIEFVKTFSPRFADPKEDRTTQVQLGAPPERNEATIAEGRKLFAKMGCANCHGKSGQGDGPSAYSLTDDSGQRIAARDFSKPSGFKAGYATKEIVRGFLTGFDGTPMPSFDGVISKTDAWKLAYYVETLVKTPVTPVAVASRGFAIHEQLDAPDVRIQLTEKAWHYEPREIRVKKGQIVEVTFEPTDNGLGAGHGFAVSSYDETAFINGAMVGAPKTVKFRADRPGKFTFYCATQCSTDKLHPLMNGTLIVEDTSAKTAGAQ